jgi:hypothetical protein
LGFGYVYHFAIYKIKLSGGLLWLQTRPDSYESQERLAPKNLSGFSFAPFLHLPEPDDLAGLLGETARDLLQEADEICAGRVRRYGGPPVELRLDPGLELHHWTIAEDWLAPDQDIKDVWEDARLGWVFSLGRAYRLSGDERYPSAFWEHIEAFLQANPPNRGLNWTSAQEAALRILALCFAGEVFKPSPSSTPERRKRLWAAIAAHARRIPPTLDYARAQNNNHLVSEALGLYTAGVVLASHPAAKRWKKLGREWLERALQTQISESGVYVQHSTNYHRLMLQAALWANMLCRYENQPFQHQTRERLAAATRWLLAHTDPLSGRVSNLGHNDGAHILPFSSGEFWDYRPTLQAAARAFLRQPCLQPGTWDETSAWFGLAPTAEDRLVLDRHPFSADVHRLGDEHTWASLRAAVFHERPAHADQLHVDVWWQGINLAPDAGTYRYTARSPWQNGLAKTRCHNTVEIDGLDQMEATGKFLWLHWAQAKILKEYSGTNTICAEHYGYTKIGVVHRRTLTRTVSGWRINDELLPGARTSTQGIRHTFRLHWLFPDVPWALEDDTLALKIEGRTVLTRVQTDPGANPAAATLRLMRAGEVIHGQPTDCPTLGWYSPTYAFKTPALCLEVTAYGTAPFKFLTEITLPHAE